MSAIQSSPEAIALDKARQSIESTLKTINADLDAVVTLTGATERQDKMENIKSRLRDVFKEISKNLKTTQGLGAENKAARDDKASLILSFMDFKQQYTQRLNKFRQVGTAVVEGRESEKVPPSNGSAKPSPRENQSPTPPQTSDAKAGPVAESPPHPIPAQSAHADEPGAGSDSQVDLTHDKYHQPPTYDNSVHAPSNTVLENLISKVGVVADYIGHWTSIAQANQNALMSLSKRSGDIFEGMEQCVLSMETICTTLTNFETKLTPNNEELVTKVITSIDGVRDIATAIKDSLDDFKSSTDLVQDSINTIEGSTTQMARSISSDSDCKTLAVLLVDRFIDRGSLLFETALQQPLPPPSSPEETRAWNHVQEFLRLCLTCFQVVGQAQSQPGTSLAERDMSLGEPNALTLPEKQSLNSNAYLIQGKRQLEEIQEEPEQGAEGESTKPKSKRPWATSKPRSRGQ